MQRLSSVNRERENVKNKSKSKEEKPNETVNSEISNDVMFLISRMNKKIIPPKPMNNTGINCLNRNRGDFLSLSGNFILKDENRTLNLKKIEISNCEKVPLAFFENLSLKSVILNNVIKTEEYHFNNFELESLHIKNSPMSVNMLVKTISNLSPRVLILENIKSFNGISDENKIFDVISQTNILSLQVINTSLDTDRLIQFIIETKMKKFYFKFENSILKYSSVCQHLTYLVIRNVNIAKYFHLYPEWGAVDILSMDSNEFVQCNIDLFFDRIKLLQLNEIRINSSFVKRLPSLSSVFIKNCSFENMSFYKLIDLQSNTLRSISFKNTSIPLDGHQYIKQKANSCKIIRSTDDGSFVYSEYNDAWIPITNKYLSSDP